MSGPAAHTSALNEAKIISELREHKFSIDGIWNTPHLAGHLERSSSQIMFRELNCTLRPKSSHQFPLCGLKRQLPVIHHVLQVELGLHV